VGEFPVAKLCDTVLSDVSIIVNVPVFSSDEQCSGNFSVLVAKACSNSRILLCFGPENFKLAI